MRLSLFLLATLGVGAQDVVERMEVTLHTVRVHVTDRKDAHVPGLTAADFEVRENGELQEITYFEEVRLARAIPREIVERDEDVIVVPGRTPTLREAPANERRAFIIFVDSGFMTRQTFDAVEESLDAFFREHVREEDSIKLVQFDVNLRQLTPFTNNPTVLLTGLARMKYRGEYRRKVSAMNIRLLGTISSYELTKSYEGEKSIRDQLFEKGRFIAEVYETQLRSLEAMARILARVPGERSVLLFSGTGYRDANNDIGRQSVEKAAEDLETYLNTADITVYSAIRSEVEPVYANTVDGTEGSDFGTGETQVDRSEQRDLTSSGEEKLYAFQKERSGARVLDSFAEMAAKETGGIYAHITGYDELDGALDTIDSYSRSYYKLGYVRTEPREAGTVRVRLAKRKRGVSLDYGRQFEGRKPYAALSEDERQAAREGMLLFGPTELEDLEAEWSHLVFRNPGGGYRIVVSGVVAGTEQSSGIELAFAAMNREDEPLDLTHITLTKEPGSRVAPFYDVLFARDLPYALRFYAHDLTQERMSLKTINLRDRLRLPLLLSDLALAQPETLAAETLNTPTPGRDNLATTRRYELDPLRMGELALKPLPIDTLDAGKSVGAMFHYYSEAELNPATRVRFILHADGKARLVASEISSITRLDAGTHAFLCTLQLPALAVEDARLELVLTEPGAEPLRRERTLDLVLAD